MPSRLQDPPSVCWGFLIHPTQFVGILANVICVGCSVHLFTCIYCFLFSENCSSSLLVCFLLCHGLVGSQIHRYIVEFLAQQKWRVVCFWHLYQVVFCLFRITKYFSMISLSNKNCQYAYVAFVSHSHIYWKLRRLSSFC